MLLLLALGPLKTLGDGAAISDEKVEGGTTVLSDTEYDGRIGRLMKSSLPQHPFPANHGRVGCH